MQSEDYIKKVENYIKEHSMIAGGDRLILGVSGGADSVALLRILNELASKMNFSICVLHVEHGIRGKESRDDAAFTEALCHRLEVPFLQKNVDAISYAKEKKLSLEEAARELRYAAFYEEAKLQGAKIAVAHNANDNAETILFQLIRGTGIRGLAGIRPVRDHLIRPLLCLTREEIEDYLKLCGQDYCTDSTNLKDDYARNKIRHAVLPLLTEINSNAVSHINHTANLMDEITTDLDQQIEEALETCQIVYPEPDCRKGKKEIAQVKNPDTSQVKKPDTALNIEKLQAFPKKLQPDILLKWLSKHSNHAKDIGSRHLEAVLALLEKQTGSGVDLPYGMRVERIYDNLVISNRKADGNPQDRKEDRQSQGGNLNASSCPVEINLQELESQKQAEISFGEYCFQFTLINRTDDFAIPTNTYTKAFDYDKISSAVVVRNRLAGDYICAGGDKKLKDYMINEKIPRDRRDGLPLLCNGSDIIWIIGYRISERYKIDSTTKRILLVETLDR